MSGPQLNRLVSLVTLCVLSLLLSAYQVFLVFLIGRFVESEQYFMEFWELIFGAILALWADADAQLRREPRFFDFGFYILALWPIFLPYYLIRTRGIIGIPQFLGFGVLYSAPFLVTIGASFIY